MIFQELERLEVCYVRVVLRDTRRIALTVQSVVHTESKDNATG